MSREYFATKLAHGRSKAPAKMAWWPRHANSTLGFLELLLSNDRRNSERTVFLAEGDLLCEAEDWDKLSLIVKEQGKKKDSLMGTHARLEYALVKAARANDVQAIERLGVELHANAERQSLLYGASVDHFPEELLRRLFKEHVSVFAECVRRRMEKDVSGTAAADARLRTNALALADLAGEWL